MDLINQEDKRDRGEATAPLAHAIRKWEEKAPELWRWCYPRHYEVGQQYASPKQLALKLLELRMQVQLSHRHSKAQQSQHMLIMWAAAGLVNLQVPLFFVAPDLLTAVRLSIPPVDLDWRMLPLPFTSAAFALPRGSLKHDSRGEVSYIWYTRIRKGEAYPVFRLRCHSESLMRTQSSLLRHAWSRPAGCCIQSPSLALLPQHSTLWI